MLLELVDDVPTEFFCNDERLNINPGPISGVTSRSTATDDLRFAASGTAPPYFDLLRTRVPCRPTPAPPGGPFAGLPVSSATSAIAIGLAPTAASGLVSPALLVVVSESAMLLRPAPTAALAAAWAY